MVTNAKKFCQFSLALISRGEKRRITYRLLQFTQNEMWDFLLNFFILQGNPGEGRGLKKVAKHSVRVLINSIGYPH